MVYCQSFLKQKGIQYDAPDSWGSGQNVGLSHLRDDPVFQFQDHSATSYILDAIFGKDQWKKPLNWGQLLVSFPEQKEWTFPYDIWHTDFDFLPPPYKIQGLLVFSFVADVAERSGGTGVISGSHLLVRRFLERERGQDFGKMKAVRKRLYESDLWLKALTSKDESVDRIEYFMKAVHPSGDISLQVTELTGATGDVIIAHPWLLHATTTNAGLKPGKMCVHRIYNDKIIQTGDLHPFSFAPSAHHCHMFTITELKADIEATDFETLALSASNCLSALRANDLEEIKKDPEEWAYFLKLEINACQSPGMLEAGTHIIAVVKKASPQASEV